MIKFIFPVVISSIGIGIQVWHEKGSSPLCKIFDFLSSTLVCSIYIGAALSLIFAINAMLGDTYLPLLLVSGLFSFYHMCVKNSMQSIFGHTLDFFGYLSIYYTVFYLVTITSFKIFQ